MNPDLQSMLLQWLESGTEIQRQHAAWRLAQSDVEPEYPSLFRQVTNAVQTVGSVMASVVRGEAVSVPQEEQDRRLVICHACEFWNATKGRCSKCGCFGAWKTWLASQRCPIEKW